MIAAPRRSEAIPNPSGEWAAFTSTSYSWETHKSSTVWNLLNLKSGEVTLLFNGSDISEMVWLGPTNTSVIYVNGTNDAEDGGISLYAADVTAIENAYVVMLIITMQANIEKHTFGVFTCAILWSQGRESGQRRYPFRYVLPGLFEWNSLQSRARRRTNLFCSNLH